MKLKGNFPSPACWKHFYELGIAISTTATHKSLGILGCLLQAPCAPVSVEHTRSDGSENSLCVMKEESIFDRVSSLSADEQLQLLNDLFVHYAKEQYSLHVPSDFIELTLRGMVQLKDRGRHDVIYGLSKGLGTTRPDKSDSLFPTTRMPIGLLSPVYTTDPG